MNIELRKLIDTGTIICGRIKKEDNIILFERIEPSEIDDIPEDEIGFATTSMGRAIFTIDTDGNIHNYKGVDSHLSTKELGTIDLVNAKSIEFDQGEDKYKVSAVVFNDKKPEIRINGSSPLEDIEIEGDINKQLADMGIKVPTISYIKEIPQDFSIKYGLPIKVNGSLDEFKSDYAVEDDKRRKRLEEIYGSDYSLELDKNQRPESMREYLQRIGFLTYPELNEKIKSLGYTMKDFIDAVDKSYSRGQRYGQAERIMNSPFRISDLETCMAKGNVEQLKTIMEFSENRNSDFTNQLAKDYGKNIATLMNNGWECENLMHRQDFSLSGEFCDDAYFDVVKREEEAEEKYKDKRYKANALKNEMKRRFTGQVMHIASCIKVIQKAMETIGKSQEEIDNVLETYVESFVQNLDMQKMSKTFNTKERKMIKKITRDFRKTKNWTKKMAGLDRKEGLVMEDAIYNAHIENNEYYSKVSNMVLERLKDKNVSIANPLISFTTRIINKIKHLAEGKDMVALPDEKNKEDGEKFSKQERKTFLEEIKATPIKTKEKIENQPKENLQKESDKNNDSDINF